MAVDHVRQRANLALICLAHGVSCVGFLMVDAAAQYGAPSHDLFSLIGK
jgi:hypothetical protein